MDHPIQPIEKDKHGILRFKENKIVSYLLDNGKISLNKIAVMDFSREDRQQFAQLIGYSLSGYSELSYVDDESYYTAEKVYEEQIDGRDARISFLQELIKSTKDKLRNPMAELFEIHPDDLS